MGRFFCTRLKDVALRLLSGLNVTATSGIVIRDRANAARFQGSLFYRFLRREERVLGLDLALFKIDVRERCTGGRFLILSITLECRFTRAIPIFDNMLNVGLNDRLIYLRLLLGVLLKVDLALFYRADIRVRATVKEDVD